MRILLIDNGISDGISGGDLHSVEVSKRWGEFIEVHAYFPEDSRHLFRNSAVKCTLFRTFFNWNRYTTKKTMINSVILYLLRIVGALLKLPTKSFHIIIASSHYPHDLIPALFQMLRNPRARLVVYDHASPMMYSKTGVRGLISGTYSILGIRLTAALASHVFVVNQAEKSRLLKLGLEEDDATITTNGINNDLPRCSGLGFSKEFDACFLGSLRKEKGVLDLIKIWEDVCRVRPRALLAIIGGGEELEKVKALLDEKGLSSNIVMFGWLYGDARFEVLAKSRMLLFPSYFESWGLAIAEAMACGLPVVAYDLPAYKEVFKGRLITVPLRDIKAMAREILHLLENPSIAVEIGKANREFVRRFDWNAVAQNELSAISRLVKSTGSL